jgi:predicted hydrocarbon binding protein
MYGGSLGMLHRELGEIMGVELARAVLFRYGFQCGEGTVRELGTEAMPSLKQFEQTLRGHWNEMRLGHLADVKVEAGAITVVTETSIERNKEGAGCDFLRGYLAGFTSAVTGKRYGCSEETCVSTGGPKCQFKLIERKG